MAASDSFHHILNLLSNDFKYSMTKYKNVLAIIGATYVSYKCVKILRFVFSSSPSLVSSIIWSKNFVKEYGQWAVVTGCTEGIGLAFADQLAGKGMNILLLSRNLSKLICIKKELEEKYEISVEYFVIDFNQIDIYFEDLIPIFLNKDIGILVNNAGVMFKYPNAFTEVPIETITEILNVNVVATTKLTHLAMTKFIQKKKGAIITLSSASSYHPTSLLSVYSATKEYLRYLMRIIEYENRGSGIIFLTLYPFYVSTRMTKYTDAFTKTSLFVPSAETYVKSALKCLGRCNESSAYFPHILQNFVFSFFPESIWMWITFHKNNRFKREFLTNHN